MALRRDRTEIEIEIAIAIAGVTGTRKEPAAAPGLALGLGQGQGQGLRSESAIGGIGIETAGRIGRRIGDCETQSGAGGGEPKIAVFFFESHSTHLLTRNRCIFDFRTNNFLRLLAEKFA